MTAAKSKKQKTKKKPTLKKIKNDTNRLFSIYIRLRDCLQTTGTIRAGDCFTCQKRFKFKELQCGHFVPGRHNSILFDERNAHAQCVGCNVFKKGNLIKYYPAMLEKYGKKVIDELEQLDTQIRPYKVYELMELNLELTLRIANLKNENEA